MSIFFENEIQVDTVYFIIFEINGKWFARLFILADLMLFGGKKV